MPSQKDQPPPDLRHFKAVVEVTAEFADEVP